ncbi:hypothetical protein Syun_012262 [Stephania yunnanensis]|uniref:Kinesin motor domain-containing protein n=1 Tax=Stephania yunnanensis TaxID=152371 RepID=A0AAP0K1K1_9MAGN
MPSTLSLAHSRPTALNTLTRSLSPNTIARFGPPPPCLFFTALGPSSISRPVVQSASLAVLIRTSLWIRDVLHGGERPGRTSSSNKMDELLRFEAARLVFWPRIVMRKWLNIRNKESDFGADPDEGDTQSDSDDEGGGHREDGQGIQMALGLHYMLLVKLIGLRARRKSNHVSDSGGSRFLVKFEEEVLNHVLVIGLRLKKRSLDAKRREALNKILDIKGDGKNWRRFGFCRVRPFLITDKRRNQEHICVRSEKLAVSFGGSKKEFGFDKVFPQNASQEDVFIEVEPILRSALDGHNVCIMAYGQTVKQRKTKLSLGHRRIAELPYHVVKSAMSYRYVRYVSFRVEILYSVKSVEQPKKEKRR